MALRLHLPRASANLQAFQIRKPISFTNTISPLLRSATQALQSRKSFSVTHPCLPLLHIIDQRKASRPQQSFMSRRKTASLIPSVSSHASFDLLQTPSFGQQSAVETVPSRTLGETLLTTWHAHLSLQRQSSRSWYLDRYAEESIEFTQAISYIDKLSEESDLYFVLSRSRFDGFPIGEVPSLFPNLGEWREGRGLGRSLAVWAYMVGKYSGRWFFYRVVTRVCGLQQWRCVREVINPARDHKLRTVAGRHGADVERFERVAKKLLRVWPLLP